MMSQEVISEEPEVVVSEDDEKFVSVQNSVEFYKTQLTSPSPHLPPRPVDVDESVVIPGRRELNQVNANTPTLRHVGWQLENLQVKEFDVDQSTRRLFDYPTLMDSNLEPLTELTAPQESTVDLIGSFTPPSTHPTVIKSPDSVQNHLTQLHQQQLPSRPYDEDLMGRLPSPPTSPLVRFSPVLQNQTPTANSLTPRSVKGMNPATITTVFKYVNPDIHHKSGGNAKQQPPNHPDVQSHGGHLVSGRDRPEPQQQPGLPKGVRFEEQYDPALFEDWKSLADLEDPSTGNLLCKKASNLHSRTMSNTPLTAFDLEYERTQLQDLGSQTLPDSYIESMTTTTAVGTTEYDSEDDASTPPPQAAQVINKDEVPVHNAAFYRHHLPSVYHLHLKDTGKKDCRVWLWKNPQGAAARKVIAEKLEKLKASRTPTTQLIKSISHLGTNAN